MSGRTNNPGQSVTARVLSILAVFEGTLVPQSLADISAKTGLAQSTAHRLLKELEEWGALQRDARGRYQIGLRLWELGQNAGRQLREIARPYLQDLFSLTQETVHIAIRDGADVLYIDRIYGTRRVPQASRVGGRLPMHATAVGKVILAYEEDWVRDSVLQGLLERRTAFTHVDPALLRRELEQVRQQGYAVTGEEVRLGSCSIAVPVFQGTGEIGAGLGLVVATANAHRMERYLPAMRGIARRIETATARIPLSTLQSAVRTKSLKTARANGGGTG
ncbi:IclR family transcriptional regulator [Arthrobacter sp. GCM10027362]|uniref:IclR family transcriptional regulator n=1 Tax=Arthrobacter sp. GCM10027362 TaxID=3273379 RepID=UPI00366B046F